MAQSLNFFFFEIFFTLFLFPGGKPTRHGKFIKYPNYYFVNFCEKEIDQLPVCAKSEFLWLFDVNCDEVDEGMYVLTRFVVFFHE